MTHHHIVQISDLHLRSTDCVGAQRLTRVLAMAAAERADLLLLTGDLVNDGQADVYDWLFDVLERTGIDHVCLAGNHDVTQELGADLPFEKRQHLPIATDPRLTQQRYLFTPKSMDDDTAWQLLTLHTPVAGQAYGALNDATLAWLDDSLIKSNTSTLIALHHHPLPVGSAWIDALMLRHADRLWHIIAKHPHVKALLCGHVHQAHAIAAPVPHPCTLYTCPAISRQFAPFNDEFGADDTLFGYRVIQLGNKSTLTSYIKMVHI